MNDNVHLGIDLAEFDLAIIVSASGEVDAGASAGASAVLIDRATNTRTRLANGGTMVDVRFMDITAIAAALHYHKSKLGQAGAICKCLILTENYELVREATSGDHTDGYEWSMLNWFSENGYKLSWKWESCMSESLKSNAQEAKAVRTAVREATEWTI